MKILSHFLSLLLFLPVYQNVTIAQTTDKKKDIDIVFIGNSITYGANVAIPKEEAPPVPACEYLRHKHGIGEVAFSNQGKSGYTTIDFSPAGNPFAKVVAATHLLHADKTRLLIFSVSLGTNDSAEEGTNGCSMDPKDYYKNMKAIIDQLLIEFPDSKIIIQQPIWYSPNTYNGAKYLAEGLARLQTYFPELKALVKEYSKTRPGHVYMGDTRAFAWFKKHHLTHLVPEAGNAGTFYLHPNKEGSRILGEFWAQAIYKKLLKS
ncbi:MAG: GDSL-type esterase/lipase family protein [Bacteroidota bacterium]